MEVEIRVDGRLDGFKKEYFFYRGMERPGERTDWCMHEYSLNPKAYAGAAVDNDVRQKVILFWTRYMHFLLKFILLFQYCP